MYLTPVNRLVGLFLAVLGGAVAITPLDAHPGDPAVVGVRHQVRMDHNRFTPRHLIIQVGDEVEFTNGPGGPHNVAFWPDSVPTDAPETLRRAMPDTIGPLIGPLVFGGDERYLISFAGAPPGVYGYYCLPHVVGGMVGEIEVLK
jgi:plastocyanin